MSKEIRNLSTITTYQSGVTQASAYRVIKKHTAAALRKYRLSCMQWFTIGTILDAGKNGMTLTEVAKSLDTTLAYTTSTINILESRGIVTRRADKADARTKWVAINPKWRPKCQDIEAHVRSELRFLFQDRISSEDLKTYVQVLYAIQQADN